MANKEAECPTDGKCVERFNVVLRVSKAIVFSYFSAPLIKNTIALELLKGNVFINKCNPRLNVPLQNHFCDLFYVLALHLLPGL